MKQLLIFLSIIVAVSLLTSFIRPKGSYQEKKRYKVELTIEEWDARIGQLEAIKNQIKVSDISYKNAAYMIDSILTPFQQLIYYQINSQIQSENGQKGIKADTTKPAKKP